MLQCFAIHTALHTRSERKRSRDADSPQRWPPRFARASFSPKVQAPPSHQVYWIHISAGEDKTILGAQSRVQKSRLSRKGFSAAGTGVTSGSSLACVSQKANSSAAACDTCRRGIEMQLTRPGLVPGSVQIPAPCPDHASTGHAPRPESHLPIPPQLQAPPSTEPNRRPSTYFPHRSMHLHAIDVHLQLQLLHRLAGLSDLGHVVGHGCSRKGVKGLAGVWTGGLEHSGSPREVLRGSGVTQ